MRGLVVWILIPALAAAPCASSLSAMPVSSSPAPAPEPPPREGGGYYSYYCWEYDPFLLFFETLLYVGLIVSALVILDEQLDNITIIVYE